MIEIVIISTLAYLVGSLPTGFLLARAYGINDIRAHGSGTIGATNVARFLGAWSFLVVFLLDFAKALVFLWFIHWLEVKHATLLVASSALVIGNTRSLFLHFTGGKGIATTCGILAFLHPTLLAVTFITWLVVFLATRIVGIASCVGLLALPVFSLALGAHYTVFLFSLFVTIWCLWLHRKHLYAFLSTA